MIAMTPIKESDTDQRPGLETGTPHAAAAERTAARCEALFSSGMHCAESVLQAVAEAHGQHNPMIPKIATGFCGGVSRTSGMCGALAGGIMALGLLSGRTTPQDSKDLCYALSHRLVGCFREAFGSTQCTDLLGCDISTAEGTRRFRERGLLGSVCAPVTRRAAFLVEEIFSAGAKPPASIFTHPSESAVKRLLAESGLPTADISERHLAHFFGCGSTTELLGVVGIEPLGDTALLRSLAVLAARRGSGIGSMLVEHAERFARNEGIGSLYLLTATAEKFFARRGYTRIPREDAPPAIRGTKEFSEICPLSSAFLVKHLRTV
jgi:amino-acid N-acetyltransferase